MTREMATLNRRSGLPRQRDVVERIVRILNEIRRLGLKGHVHLQGVTNEKDGSITFRLSPKTVTGASAIQRWNEKRLREAQARRR